MMECVDSLRAERELGENTAVFKEGEKKVRDMLKMHHIST